MTNILEVQDLKTYFYASHGLVKAVDGIDLNIEKGKVSGLVGESGSGKTLTTLSILRLVPYPGKIAGGSILFNGTELLNMDEKAFQKLRGGRISVVFQEPASSLDPVFSIGSQMIETVLAHDRSSNRSKARELAMEYLKDVHIQDVKKVFLDYPHQLSGGIKQRVMIAMALINSPELLILDEPTTALDVTIQAEILDLLDEIIDKENVSILFISHDFGIISRMCDDIAVMYKGKIVERGRKEKVLYSPENAYTISLLESVKALG